MSGVSTDPIQQTTVKIKTEALKKVEDKFEHLEKTLVKPIEKRFDKLESRARKIKARLDTCK